MRRMTFVLAMALMPAVLVAGSIEVPLRCTAGVSGCTIVLPGHINQLPAVKGQASARVIEKRHIESASTRNEEASLKRDQDDLVAQQEMARWSKWMFWATAFSALASVLAACLLYMTLHMTQTTSHKQLRAYVSMSFFELPVFSANQHIQMKFVLKNRGQTPAKNVRSAFRVEVWPYPLPPDWDIGELRPDPAERVVLQAGGDQLIGHRSTRVIDQEAIARVTDGTSMRLYAVGLVEYEDVFGRPHSTQMCVYFVPNHELRQVAEGVRVERGIQSMLAGSWNDAK